ncbi:MAG: sulfatase-like hydrolase/transferase [Actinomycetia bacterium]|nr:sulfatase-like hydrolase/transferase [Actinomycetes bacterium]
MSSLSRREFIGSTTAAAGAVAAAGLATAQSANASADKRGVSSKRARPGAPNVILILVDEMRFPMTFPGGIKTPEAFLSAHMPNLAKLWKRGVKFSNHYTSGTACSPARACLVTGLYPHQNWCLQTRKGQQPGANGPNAPALQREFPTYGKLMRSAGYRTPYVGKWHLSNSPGSETDQGASSYLNAYGYEGLTMPDPIGTNGQGTDDDGNIAYQATQWLSAQKKSASPFCLTVSFVNPHDKEFFWSGTDADTYNNLFIASGDTAAVNYDAVPPLDMPKNYGYPALPDNWESTKTLESDKPGWQVAARAFTDLMWGGVTDDPTQLTEFTMEDYPNLPGSTIAKAPFPYWSRSLDSYTQVMNFVDQHIGAVVRAIPKEIRDNTVIIMTADHGDYASAHGFASNKAGSMYEEAVNVPLIVMDPRERITGDLDTIREQLTSSVDMMPMLATLAHGNKEWMKGAYADTYSERLDLLEIVKSDRAKGRDHIVMASDEWIPKFYDYNNSPRHILGLRTPEMKIAAYSYWDTAGFMDRQNVELESYNYDTKRGRLELDNQRADSGKAQKLAKELLNRFNRTQMQAPLPKKYRAAQARGKAEYLAYIALLDSLNPDGSSDMSSPNWVGNFLHLGQ